MFLDLCILYTSLRLFGATPSTRGSGYVCLCILGCSFSLLSSLHPLILVDAPGRFAAGDLLHGTSAATQLFFFAVMSYGMMCFYLNTP